MRRIKSVLATIAVVVAAFAAFSGPAIADDLNCRDARGYAIRCNGELYVPYDNAHSSYNDYYDYNYYPPFYSPFYYNNNDYNYDDYEDYLDELEDAIEDGYWGRSYYNW